MSHASRRDILKLAGGSALLLGFSLRPGRAAAPPLLPNAFIRIDPAGDITLIMPNTEFGQGVWTSSAMLIAEELEVGLDQVRLEPAPPDNAKYTSAGNGEQATGGSSSMRDSWLPLRQAGAAARTMLVAAAAKTWGVPVAECTAERATVHHGSGRSLGYGTLVATAITLPVPAPSTLQLKDAAQFKLIGKPLKRLDTPAKVNGTAQFGIDVRLPGMQIATAAACPVRGGKLVSCNEAAARAVPGVVDLVRLDDALAVIAEHFWAAKQGLAAAAPVWDEGPGGKISTAQLLADLENASHRLGVVAKHTGDPDAAIAGAAKKLELVYQLPFLSHAPMEPVNATVHIRPDGADLYTGTQVPPRAQAAVAKEAGLKPEQVTVHNQLMGGAFGRRLDVDFIIQAARIAKHVPYPVKLIWSREEDITQDLFRPYYYDRIAAGLGADGRIVGWTHRTTGSSVLARWAPDGMEQGGKLDPDTVDGAIETPYIIPAQRNEYVRCEPGVLTTAWWRGVGPTHNLFVVESMIDELAALAGHDPLDFRRRNLAKEPRALTVLNLAAEKSNWSRKLAAGTGRGLALQYAFGTHMATVLELAVTSKGEIQLREANVAVDCGPVVNPDTLRAQVEGGLIFGLSMALYSEITVKHGRVEQTNFDTYRVLRIDQAPKIQVHIVHNPLAPIGGIGETACAAASPALANAIYAATGKRLRRIPFDGQITSA